MFNTLSLVYTQQCNAYCRTCHADAGPHRKEKMNLGRAKSYIQQSLEISSMKALLITGGEPLLFFDEVEDLLAFAHSRGLSTKIISNAYWAESEEIAILRLANLRKNGLNFISLSTDRYHQEFVSINHVRNALRAARKLMVPCEVIMIVGKQDTDSLYDQIQCLENLEEFFVTSDSLSSVQSFSDEIFKKKIGLFLMPLQCFGRGIQFFEDSIQRLPEDLNPSSCHAVGRVAKVLPNGDAYWCCCTDEQEGKAGEYFRLGNLNRDRLKDLDEKVEVDPLCEYLAYQGPVNLLKDVLGQPGILKAKKKFTCICDICNETFRIAGKETLYSLARRQTILTKTLRNTMSKLKSRG